MSIVGKLRGGSIARQRGISLVEALVALLVLSIGMLGIAALFVESVRSSRTALLRTQAVNLVSDMADRIRANSSARGAYDTATGPGAATRGCAPETGNAGGNCGIEELAQDDLARWQASVEDLLPATADDTPRTQVTFTPGATLRRPDRYTIRVSWGEPGARMNADDAAAPVTYWYESDVVLMPRAPIT